MFLGVYHFSGEPGELSRAYDRLVALLPPDSFEFHACIERADRLLAPRVEPLGDVHAARVRGGQTIV